MCYAHNICTLILYLFIFRVCTCILQVRKLADLYFLMRMYKPAYNYAYISKKDFQTDEVEKAGFRGGFNVSLNRLGLTTQLLLNWQHSPCSCSPAQTQVKVVFEDPAHSTVTSINIGPLGLGTCLLCDAGHDFSRDCNWTQVLICTHLFPSHNMQLNWVNLQGCSKTMMSFLGKVRSRSLEVLESSQKAPCHAQLPPIQPRAWKLSLLLKTKLNSINNSSSSS